MIQCQENLVTDGRTRVISQDAVRIMWSVQHKHVTGRFITPIPLKIQQTYS